MYQKDNDLTKAHSVTRLNELNKELLLGAERGDLELVKRCLRSGADPTARVRFGRNALHIAAERGDLKLGEVLVKAVGTDINVGTYHSYTPLHLACNSHKHDFLEFLLEQGANVNIQDKLGRTSLHYAVGNRDERMTLSCLKYGADVNALDSMQNSPLSLAAVDTCSLSLVDLLLRHKANPNLPRKLCIPIFLDCILNVSSKLDSRDTYTILSLLLKYGVSPNVVDPATKKNGMHYAAMNGNLELGIFLVRHGTDPLAKDSLGRTSLDIAHQFNHYEMELWLKHLLHERDYVSDMNFTCDDMYF